MAIISYEHMDSRSQVLEDKHFFVTVTLNTAGTEIFKRRLQLLHKRCCAGTGFTGILRCQELARKALRLPVNHLSSRGTQILHPGRADTHQDEREVLGPSSLMAAGGCLQVAVEKFHHAIGSWVEGCGMDVSVFGQDVQVPEQERFELPPLVCGDSQRHPEAANPPLEESAGHGECLLVGYGNGFRPARESFYNGQAIPLTLGRWHDEDDQVDILELR
jgi:hypothetical protein